ncbi:hypothetical protein Emag_005069 [Eimeria magna]
MILHGAVEAVIEWHMQRQHRLDWIILLSLQAEGKVASTLKEAAADDRVNNGISASAGEAFWRAGHEELSLQSYPRRDYTASCPLDWAPASEESSSEISLVLPSWPLHSPRLVHRALLHTGDPMMNYACLHFSAGSRHASELPCALGIHKGRSLPRCKRAAAAQPCLSLTSQNHTTGEAPSEAKAVKRRGKPQLIAGGPVGEVSAATDQRERALLLLRQQPIELLLQLSIQPDAVAAADMHLAAAEAASAAAAAAASAATAAAVAAFAFAAVKGHEWLPAAAEPAGLPWLLF